ncbi:hypothetical protein EVA_17259 [gut metagenome]|uniref:Uncharacterized protein n=1 Tax=gut metagenome TaxID=749906 RepID=J9C4B6_9ZZZZ
MRPWRHFAENHVITLYKKLHTEDSIASQCFSNPSCYIPGLGKCFCTHCLRLP